MSLLSLQKRQISILRVCMGGGVYNCCMMSEYRPIGPGSYRAHQALLCNILGAAWKHCVRYECSLFSHTPLYITTVGLCKVCLNPCFSLKFWLTISPLKFYLFVLFKAHMSFSKQNYYTYSECCGSKDCTLNLDQDPDPEF